MKAISLCLFAGLLSLLGGCATPGAGDPNQPQIDVTACRGRIPQALEFALLPGQARNFLSQMSAASGPELRELLNQYYQTLGYNLSSLALMLDSETASRTSLRLRENLDPAVKAAWLRNRIERGQSLFTLEDVHAVTPDGDFLRVDLKPGLPIHGSLYVFCGVIEGRTIGEQTFVDFYNERGEARKISLVALAGWMESQ